MTFINVSKVPLRATGDPVTRDRHYSDHPCPYVSPRPGIEPGLTVCQVTMLPTQPPGDLMCLSEQTIFLPWYSLDKSIANTWHK